MSLQRSGQQIKTSCKECVFAEYTDKTQVGCSANRIHHFKDLAVEAYDDDKEFYVINTFCNFYRQDKWLKDGEDNLKRARLENQISCEVLIDCNNMNPSFKEKIIQWLDDLSLVPDPKPIIKITLYHSIFANKNISNHIAEILKHKRRLFIANYSDENEYLHQLISSSQYQYHMIVKEDTIPDPSIFYEIDENINDKFNRFIVAKKHDLFIISNMAYNIESLNSNNADYYVNIHNLINWVKDTKIYLEI
jgi:hypothetical protein